MAVAAESVILLGQKVKVVSQSLANSRAAELAGELMYTFIAAPCPEYRCGIVWGDKGLYAVFLVPQHEVTSSLPPFICHRWPHLRPSAELNQTHTTTPVTVELPAQAHGTLVLSGTEFQRQVWRALLDIPVGETRTYADIAQSIGRAQAWRAVANAVAANPLLYLVPCHRVVPRKGGVGKYRGGTELKRYFLALEGLSFTEEEIL
ncbi:MAG: methylated-DNA--[protein]-cysteine S-methyltransferase [Desulfuromonadaceae bacterium]|nr:methylated-DNA--[protein]-cysteine S-methyltransferase [Desulfuromonadaceae bacterium]